MPDNYLTLAEAEKYRQNEYDAYVIPNIIEESPILSGGVNDFSGPTPAALPFQITSDRLLTIVRESTSATVSWYDPAEPVTGSPGTVATTSFTIRGLKAVVVVPREYKEGYSSLVDVVATQLGQQLKAMTSRFMTTFYYGKNSANSKETDGLHSLVSTSGTPDLSIAQGSSSTKAALSLANLDTLLSDMKGRKPDMILVSRQLYKQFTKARRNTATGVAGNFSAQPITELGMPVLHYNEIPLFRDDYIEDDETVTDGDYGGKDSGTANNGTSLFVVRFGPNDLHAVTFNQAAPKMVVLPGPHPNGVDGDVVWVTWDVAIVLKSKYAIGRIGGIDPTVAIVI